MVDVEGVNVLGGAAEKLIDRFKDCQLPCTPDTVKVVQDAYQALVEYLDELLAGTWNSTPCPRLAGSRSEGWMRSTPSLSCTSR